MRWTKAKLRDLQDRLGKAYPDAKCALDHGDPFELVVATILSAQCTDARVNLTTPALFAKYPDAAALASAKLPELEALIHSTGFYHNKARNLIGLGQALLAKHGGKVPSDPAELEALPGVGQKTANVVLANAFGVPALAVDTHIFRVARRLGLSDAKTPEKVEADLCRRFPESAWIELHHQLIFHGRRRCDARKPDCAGCPVLGLCDVGRGKAADPHSGLTLTSRSAPATPPPGPRAEEKLPARRKAPQAEPATPPPLRIISLVPSVTELLAQWNLAARLVGRTRYCIAPKWIRATVPEVGGTKDPNLARIKDLKPDLVILERDENKKTTADALTKLGIPWLALEVRSLEGCAAAWEELGGRLGVGPVAKARAAALRAQLKKKQKQGPRTLTLIWQRPWMSAGPDTYLGDLVRQAGFSPIGPPRWTELSEAALKALAPEVILLPTEPFRFTKRHVNELQKRFPEAAIHLLDGQAMTWYLSRTEEGLALLRGLPKT
ncbi:MAG: endonuclease III [Holophagaceae bacterium]|nr:endonuclease III [Holophagaceae bacterium]